MRLTGGRPPARGRVQAREAPGASGPTPGCCACFGAARSPSCATRSSRSIRRCSAGSRPPGRGSSSGAAAPTGCSMSSSNCRVRRLPASMLESDILPARIDGYDPADLDAVAAAGEVVWVGVESLGERDGRMALYLADHLARLLPPRDDGPPRRRTARRSRRPAPHERATSGSARSRPVGSPIGLSDRESRSSSTSTHGATFFGPLHEAVGGGYPGRNRRRPVESGLAGLVTNDTFHAVRAFTRARALAAARVNGRTCHVSIAAAGAAVRRRTLVAGSPRRGPEGPHDHEAVRPSGRAPATRDPTGSPPSRNSCSPVTAC